MGLVSLRGDGGAGTGRAGNAQRPGKLRGLWDQAPGAAATVTPSRGSPASRILEFYRSEQESWMRNTWVPQAPKAPSSLLSQEESGLQHLSIKPQSSLTPRLPPSQLESQFRALRFLFWVCFLFLLLFCFGGCTPGVGNPALAEMLYRGGTAKGQNLERPAPGPKLVQVGEGTGVAVAGFLLSC